MLRETVRTRTFRPHGQVVIVELLEMQCLDCGVAHCSPAQHDENLRRLAARKIHYGSLPMGEEILGLRRQLGLSRGSASQLLRLHRSELSRYERELDYPDEKTTRRLRDAIDDPASLLERARKVGIALAA